MQINHARTGAVAGHRRVSDRRVNVRRTTPEVSPERSSRRAVAPAHTLEEQVRILRMAVSELQFQVRGLAGASSVDGNPKVAIDVA